MLEEPTRHQLPHPARDSGSPSSLSRVAAANTKPIHSVQDVVDTDTVRRAGLEHRWPPVVGAVLVEPKHCLDLGNSAVGTLVVRLVHDEQIGDLHDARLERLHTVSGPRHRHHDRHVGGTRDLDLRLADTDRLDDDHVEPAGVQDHRRVTGGARHTAQLAPRRHTPHKYTGVAGMRLHPHPVAEQRATAERAGRIHRQHTHGATTRTQHGDDPVDQGTLPDTRWAGHPYQIRLAASVVNPPDDRSR